MARFTDLPIEIRLFIWRYALLPPTRKPEVVTITPGCFQYIYPHVARPIPSVFQLCYESRMASLDFMENIEPVENFLSWNIDFDDPNYKSSNVRSTIIEIRRHSRIQPRVDFDHDKFYLRHLNYLHNRNSSLRLIARTDAIRISHLVFDLIDMPQILYGREHLEIYQSMKTLTIVLPDGFDKPLRAKFCVLKDMCNFPQVNYRGNMSILSRLIFDFRQAKIHFHGFGISKLVEMLERRPPEVQASSCWIFELILRFLYWRFLKNWKWPKIDFCVRSELRPNAPMLTEVEKVEEELIGGFEKLSV